MELRSVNLSQIDPSDCRFEIRNFRASPRLADSLTRLGILDPPWLWETDGPLVIVDGFKRLKWAMENRLQSTVCRVFDKTRELPELWMRRLEKKIFEGEVNLAEKAQIVAKLAVLFQPDPIPQHFTTGLTISNRADIVQKWILLVAGGPETLERLASGDVSERAALQVSDWDKKSRNSVLTLLGSLRCSASIQVEIAEALNDMAAREGKTCAQVTESPRLREILDSADLNHRQKTQAIRSLLHELNHPRLTARLNEFRSEVESLGLPPGVRISHPASFEGGSWSMELSFSGPGELRKALESTKSLVESGRLDNLFKASNRQFMDGQDDEAAKPAPRPDPSQQNDPGSPSKMSRILERAKDLSKK